MNIDAAGKPAAEVDKLIVAGKNGSLSDKAVAEAMRKNLTDGARGPLSADVPNDDEIDDLVDEDGTVQL